MLPPGPASGKPPRPSFPAAGETLGERTGLRGWRWRLHGAVRKAGLSRSAPPKSVRSLRTSALASRPLSAVIWHAGCSEKSDIAKACEVARVRDSGLALLFAGTQCSLDHAEENFARRCTWRGDQPDRITSCAAHAYQLHPLTVRRRSAVGECF